MNDQYAEIKAELELTRRELLKRLSSTTDFEMSKEFLPENSTSEKEKLVLHHVKEDLQDVERALGKLHYGSYGICEETGQHIPLDKLKILPTARTVNDFTFSELFISNRHIIPSLDSVIST
ncbi:TraR/DksA family transcriptional regulator [Litchfieldia alkalitelluris]|uniref:TraR/DksA family transcriptional regulator n=1 Tax=Litchfieldia alkalitelluris TaxID=304268 RepID=UPI0009967764|nr:TraR/DksA C4-type zinc finger protein [Litchfieldia alkalitelluris]